MQSVVVEKKQETKKTIKTNKQTLPAVISAASDDKYLEIKHTDIIIWFG